MAKSRTQAETADQRAAAAMEGKTNTAANTTAERHIEDAGAKAAGVANVDARDETVARPEMQAPNKPADTPETLADMGVPPNFTAADLAAARERLKKEAGLTDLEVLAMNDDNVFARLRGIDDAAAKQKETQDRSVARGGALHGRVAERPPVYGGGSGYDRDGRNEAGSAERRAGNVPDAGTP